MDKLRVVILADSMDAKAHLRSLLTVEDEDIIIAGYAGFDVAAMQKVMGLFPDVVLCATTGEGAGMLELTQEIYSRQKGCAVLLVSRDMDIEYVNQALRAGMRQVLPWDVPAKELQDNMRRICLLERQRFSELQLNQKRRCRTLGFFSGKGGTGKTTMAVNCAVILARRGAKVILIDCDLQFGDVSLHMDLDPKETLLELAQEEATFNAELINSFVQLHGSGVSVLCAPKSPEFAEYVTGKHIESVIDILRPYYEYIVLDLPAAFSDTSLVALENCDLICMVYNMDISCLKNAKTCVTVLDSLKQREKLRLIINKFQKGMISLRDYEAALELKPLGTVSYDQKTAVGSLDRGFPLVSHQPRSTIAREIRNIAAKVAQ